MHAVDQRPHQTRADAAAVPAFGDLNLGDVRVVAHRAEADDAAAGESDKRRRPGGMDEPAEPRADQAGLRILADDRDALGRQIPRQIARDQRFDERRDLEMIGGQWRPKDDLRVTPRSSQGCGARKAGYRRS